MSSFGHHKFNKIDALFSNLTQFKKNPKSSIY